MKQLFVISIILTGIISRLYTTPDIKELRQLYLASATEKDSTARLSALLLTIDKQSSPLLICYKGVAQMMEAKYAFGPLSKYQRFNTGRGLIEYAMVLDSDNVEIRYLRFTIQKSIPSFLGYANNEVDDKNYLVNHYAAIDDRQLKNMVSGFLTASGACSPMELKKLKD